MPTKEFPAMTLSEYPPTAQIIQQWTLEWQVRRGIILPTREYLAHQLGVDPKAFSRLWYGNSKPRAEYAIAFARFFAKRVEEVLEAFGHPTFVSLIEFLTQERERLGALDVYRREQLRLLQQTTLRSWETATDEWKESVELALCHTKPIEEKIRDVCAVLSMRETALRKHPLTNS